MFPRLIDMNAGSRYLRGSRKILVFGRCLEMDYPEVLGGFDEHVKVSACLEEEHMNMVGFKLAGVIVRGDYEEIAVLTVDGSLHCVQLHHMVEEVCRLLSNPPRRRHMVVRRGNIVEVSEESVKVSRYLARVDSLLLRNRRGHSPR